MINIFSFVLKLILGRTATGDITVSSSISEIEIKTGWTPKQVFINIDSNTSISVCGAHQDWFDVKVLIDGFIIKYNIQSSFRKITWIAIP